MKEEYALGWDGNHCTQHGALGYKFGQYTKNGHCSLCWPAQPITSIEQVVDLLEVCVDRSKENKLMGKVEEFQKIIDYIKP